MVNKDVLILTSKKKNKTKNRTKQKTPQKQRNLVISFNQFLGDFLKIFWNVVCCRWKRSMCHLTGIFNNLLYWSLKYLEQYRGRNKRLVTSEYMLSLEPSTYQHSNGSEAHWICHSEHCKCFSFENDTKYSY